MKKTILCLLLALGLLMLSAAAMAASDPDNYFFDLNEGNITIADGDTPGMVKVTYGNPQTTTAEFDPQEHVITVGGSISPNPLQLSINTTVPVTIIYQVYIGNNSIPNTISIADNADVTLSLTGSANDVSGTLAQPGIELGSGSKLTIQATEHNNILRVYGISKAILGPDDDEPPATVILNSGTVAIIPNSGISGNVNLVINGGQFVANGTTINVNSLIITGGELWAGSDSSTKVTYDGLENNPDSYSNIHYAASILPHSVDNYGELIVFDELTLPVDLTIPAEKKLILASYHDSSLTIPDDRSLTCNGVIYIYTDSTLTNNGTLTIKNYSILTGKMTNTGTLIINDSSLVMCEGLDFGTLNNTGTISGTGFIDPPLTQNQPKFLTIKSIENGTVTLAEVEAGITDAEYSKDGTSWQDSPVFERVDLSAGQTFYARYKANNFFNASGEASITVYPVSLNANGGTIASGKNVGYYIAGQSTPLPTDTDDVKRTGYTFAGWYDNKELTGDPVTAIGANETGKREYWAKWTPDTYTVTLDTNGGTIGSGNLTGYTYGEGATLPTDVKKDNYSFAGWYDNKELTGAPVTAIGATETGEKKYWAKWTPDTYTVTLNTNGGTIGSGNLTGYTYGVGATLPTDVTRAGYAFAGWYDNKELTGDPVTAIGANETGKREYWAKWVIVLTDPDGAVVSGYAAFANRPPVKVPTLVLPEGTTLGGSVMLKYVKVDTTRENTAIYDVYLIDQSGNRVKLPAACTLCLPYPEGLNQSSTSAYRIHILHEMEGGRSEDFDSMSGGLELTPQGLCVRISSLSPFTITWERFPEINLPQTGDSSPLLCWAALLGASCAGLWFLNRRRA